MDDVRPRVALVAHDIRTPGGMERVYTELLHRASSDIDFTIISSTLSDSLRPLVRWRRVPVVRRPIPLKFLLFYMGAAIQIARARPEIVHSSGAIVPNKVDVASVHYCHAALRARTGSLAPPGLGFGRRMNRLIGGLLALLAERWSYRPQRTRVLAAVSLGVRDELRHHFPGVPVVITPNGVDAHRFVPDVATRKSIRAAERLDDGDVVALFVGGDWHRKGLDLAIRGLAAPSCRDQAVRLWVVGLGDRERFTSLALASGVAERVHFFGPRADVERFYQSADMLLLPSRYEGCALVALEAAACGLPVIGTKVGGVDEIVGGGNAGMLVSASPDTVGDAIARLAADPALRWRMGAAARERARAFGWDRSVESVVELYRQLLAASGAPQMNVAGPP